MGIIANVSSEHSDGHHMIYRVPALVILVLVSLLGIVGNAFVIYIYGYQLKLRPISIYFIQMASMDFVCCIIGMPMEIYGLISIYSYPYDNLCKIQAFIFFISNVFSMAMIFVMALGRYLSVTRNLKDYVSYSTARNIGTVILISAAFAAIPIHFWSRRRPFTLYDGTTVLVCVTFLEKVLWYYYMCVLSLFVFLCIMMFIIYRFTFMALGLQTKWNDQKLSEATTERKIFYHEQVRKNIRQQRVITVLTMSIAIVSFFNQTTFLGSLFLRKTMTQLTPPKLYDYFLFLLGETWFLESTLNPILHIVLNPEFRDRLFRIFKCCCLTRRSKEDNLDEEASIGFNRPIYRPWPHKGKRKHTPIFSS